MMTNTIPVAECAAMMQQLADSSVWLGGLFAVACLGMFFVPSVVEWYQDREADKAELRRYGRRE